MLWNDRIRAKNRTMIFIAFGLSPILAAVISVSSGASIGQTIAVATLALALCATLWFILSVLWVGAWSIVLLVARSSVESVRWLRRHISNHGHSA